MTLPAGGAVAIEKSVMFDRAQNEGQLTEF